MLRLAKVFEKDPRDENSHPLDECHQWALAHCLQTSVSQALAADDDDDTDGNADMHKQFTPMLMIVQRYLSANKRELRRYRATTLDSFYSFYNNLGISDTARHCDEVIAPGPCKAYLDLELSNKREVLLKHQVQSFDELCARADSAAQTLIDTIVKRHQDNHGQEVQAIVLAAHSSRKWSKHVVFRGSLWRSANDFGAFAKQLVHELSRDTPLIDALFDASVYGRLRCMRCYRSSKPDEQQRSFRFESGPAEYAWHRGEPLSQTLNRALLFDTLITAIPLRPLRRKYSDNDSNSSDTPLPPTDDEEEEEGGATTNRFVTSAFLERYPNFISVLGLQPIRHSGVVHAKLLRPPQHDNTNTGEEIMMAVVDDTDEEQQLIGKFMNAVRGRFRSMEPYSFRINPVTSVTRVECRSRNCPFINGEHRSNHVFLLVNVLERTYAVGCYDQLCKRNRKLWQSFERDEELYDICAEMFAGWRYAQPLACLPAVCTKALNCQ